MPRRVLWFALGASLALLAFVGCGTPQPVPDPVTPSGTDPFAAKVFRCGPVDPVNAVSGPSVLRCLTDAHDGNPIDCVQKLAAANPTYSLDEMACMVRYYGGEANAAMLASGQTTGTVEATIATAARNWITGEGVGYRQ